MISKQTKPINLHFATETQFQRKLDFFMHRNSQTLDSTKINQSIQSQRDKQNGVVLFKNS